MRRLKQVIVLDEDLGISKGKQISQACHASLKSYKKASREICSDWEDQGSRKIALDIGDGSLRERLEKAKSLQIPAALVQDAGLTEVEPGTVTALGVGPAEEDKIDKITGDLKLIE
ncbi:MAG: aminoacyl-tRNA hydrolase [Candidatus Nanohalobium sp.]